MTLRLAFLRSLGDLVEDLKNMNPVWFLALAVTALVVDIIVLSPNL